MRSSFAATGKTIPTPGFVFAPSAKTTGMQHSMMYETCPFRFGSHVDSVNNKFAWVWKWLEAIRISTQTHSNWLGRWVDALPQCLTFIRFCIEFELRFVYFRDGLIKMCKYFCFKLYKSRSIIELIHSTVSGVDPKSERSKQKLMAMKC